MTQSPIRVRFAPSPTGDFHVGGARTALFNYLFARHHRGTFILRIEDTDRRRFHPQALEWLQDGLRYLGIDWDEGPGREGACGPYFQSQRLSIYRSYIESLLEKGKVYRCFCTPERLQGVIEHQKQVKSDYLGYDRHCRHLSSDEIEARLKEKLPYTVRFKMPLDGETTVTDYIRGEIRFDNRRLQDAVLMKSDGYPTYHFANVIDDHLMKISHILRGDEWVNSLPLHIRLYQALGWDPPVLAHLPVILNPSGKGKMSKRENRAPDGTVRPVFVRQYQEAGYLPQALVNFMALTGWSFDDHQELFTMDELITRFSLDKVHKSPAVWNYDKLNQFNSQYIRGLEDEELAGALTPFLSKAGLAVNQPVLLRIIPLIRERITLLSEGPQWVDFYFQEPKSYVPTLLIPRKESPESTLDILKQTRTVLEQVAFEHQTLYNSLKTEALKQEKKPGPFFQPLRVAVCGKTVAPPLFESLEILGREIVIQRIDRAIEYLTPLCTSHEEANG